MPKDCNPEQPAEARTGQEYAEGKQAFADKKKADDNPHPSGNPRLRWYLGFYDARINHRLGHVFEKHGMAHP